MSEDNKKGSAQALVREILSGVGGKLSTSATGADGAPPLPTNEGPGGSVPLPPAVASLEEHRTPAEDGAEDAAEAEAATLIDLYFELEDAIERDVLFDQIVALSQPIVTEFLRTMMEHDEDDYVRAAAAAELARRGSPDGLAALEADLVEPEELYFFEHAMQVLSELKGPAFYDTIEALWRDPERDADLRREAMVGMETSDPARAMADFVGLIESVTDVSHMPDDQIEVAMLAFVRHEHVAALAALQGLRQRIAATEMDADERAELVAFVQEGIDLLEAV
jgi:hypothetical protein